MSHAAPGKQPDETWESYAERLIRNAMATGNWTAGTAQDQPLTDLGELDDEDWWLKRKLKREQLSCLPPTLAIRADLARTLEALIELSSEAEVRKTLIALNERIREANFAPTGAPSTTMPVDIEAAVAKWQQRRAAPSD